MLSLFCPSLYKYPRIMFFKDHREERRYRENRKTKNAQVSNPRPLDPEASGVLLCCPSATPFISVAQFFNKFVFYKTPPVAQSFKIFLTMAAIKTTMVTNGNSAPKMQRNSKKLQRRGLNIFLFSGILFNHNAFLVSFSGMFYKRISTQS